jgi:tRNA A37 threonylcarbamoyladenosine dehydratase
MAGRVEIGGLLAPEHAERFGAVGRLLGPAGLGRLAGAHVCVVGVGGVGSWTIEALARSGVGALTLIDLDDVCVSNINRQVHATDGTVGRPKVEVMAERARAIHPGVEVRAVATYLTEANAASLLAGGFDVVADGIDNAKVKAQLIATCRDLGLRVVTSGGAGGRRDPTRLRVADLSQSRNDTLLHAVRKHLRQRHGFPREGRRFGVRCVFSEELPSAPQLPAGACAPQPGPGSGDRRALNCDAGLGTAAWVTGAFGFALAALAVEDVVGAAGLDEVSA